MNECLTVIVKMYRISCLSFDNELLFRHSDILVCLSVFRIPLTVFDIKED